MLGHLYRLKVEESSEVAVVLFPFSFFRSLHDQLLFGQASDRLTDYVFVNGQ